jgi:hypothetical protein
MRRKSNFSPAAARAPMLVRAAARISERLGAGFSPGCTRGGSTMHRP